MSDDAIRAALAKRADAEERIRKYERGIKKAKEQIVEINNFIRAWEKFSGKAVEGLNAIKALNYKGEFVATVDGQQVRMAPVNSRKEEVAEVAKLVLSESGQSMPRSELFKELIKRGLTITGKDPEMVLSTMLWRTKRTSGIERLKSGGYCLRENANPDEVDDSEAIELDAGEY